MTNEPMTAKDFEELRKNDKWTTGRLIVTALITLACAFTFLYLIAG